MKPVELVYDFIPAIGKTASSPPVLIFHGLLGTRLNFVSLAKRKELCGISDVYVLDMRNHGWSPHADEHSAEAMAADVKHFLLKKRIPQAVFVGFSMGGKAAMHLAFSNPELCKGMLLLDVGPFNYPASRYKDVNYQHVLDALSSIDLASLKSKDAVKELISQKVTQSRPMVDFLMSNLVTSSNQTAAGSSSSPGLSWRCNLPILQRDYFRHSSWTPLESQTYTGPVKFVRGSESNYIPFDGLATLTKHFPNVNLEEDLVTVEGGHWVHLQDPRRVLKTAEELIRQTSLIV